MTHIKQHHHGKLRPKLIDAANAIIRVHGIDGLSMRRLADQVGVSRTAPYHYFKDKNALLCAIAELGFEAQDRIIREVLDGENHENSQALFSQWVRAYIRFASDNPQTYDLMYGKEIWKHGNPTPSLQQISKASFHWWVELVEQMQMQQVLPDNRPALRTAQASWATLHGLSRLLIDGIYVEREDLEEIADTAVALIAHSHAS